MRTVHYARRDQQGVRFSAPIKYGIITCSNHTCMYITESPLSWPCTLGVVSSFHKTCSGQSAAQGNLLNTLRLRTSWLQWKVRACTPLKLFVWARVSSQVRCALFSLDSPGVHLDGPPGHPICPCLCRTACLLIIWAATRRAEVRRFA